MEIELSGKVEVSVRLENEFDVTRHRLGEISADAVRRIDVSNAIVDTNTTGLSAPRSVIQQLGLSSYGSRQRRTAKGYVERMSYSGVRLTIQDRDMFCEVTELPDGSPVLIGLIPLGGLDFVVDPVGRRLIGNPAHGGVWMHENY